MTNEAIDIFIICVLASALIGICVGVKLEFWLSKQEYRRQYYIPPRENRPFVFRGAYEVESYSCLPQDAEMGAIYLVKDSQYEYIAVPTENGIKWEKLKKID